MIEILVCEDVGITKNLYQNCGIDYNENSLAIRAMNGVECLGFALFLIEGEKETVFAVEPKEDIMLADGLLRSALHVGTERGITDAFYYGSNYEDLYAKIDFIESSEENRLKLQNLFSDCCHCNKE